MEGARVVVGGSDGKVQYMIPWGQGSWTWGKAKDWRLAGLLMK